LQEAVKAEFVSRFKEVFAHIEREESFVGVVRRSFIAASLEAPKSLLVYEVWRETSHPQERSNRSRTRPRDPACGFRRFHSVIEARLLLHKPDDRAPIPVPS
jgi:hypothetical protein